MSFTSSHILKMVALTGISLIMINPAQAAGNVTKGAKIYAGTCIACHGEDGKGAIPGVPNFTLPNGRLSKSDDLLIEHIDNGFESPNSEMAMPELGGNEDLSAEDVENVLAYLRATFQPHQ